MTEDMVVKGLVEAVAEATASPDVAAIVLRGAVHHNVRRFMSLWECPKPVIAEICGWAIGGATDLVMCADLLFMAEDANIGYAPSRLYGLPTTMLWIHRLGLEHAKRYLLTGRAIDARTAHRIGLVSEVVPADELSAAAEAEARKLATIPANQLALNSNARSGG